MGVDVRARVGVRVMFDVKVRVSARVRVDVRIRVMQGLGLVLVRVAVKLGSF